MGDLGVQARKSKVSEMLRGAAICICSTATAWAEEKVGFGILRWKIFSPGN